MAIENAKLVNLQDAKVLYDDLRGRVEGLIDDTSTSQSKVWSASKTSEETSALKSAKAPIITETISTPAAVQTFTDGADGIPMGVEVEIAPVQDLHGYDNPWPAGGGKNLLNNTAETTESNGVTFTVNSDGTVSTSGTATGTAVLRILQTFSENVDLIVNGCPPGGSYDSSYSMLVAKQNGSGVQASSTDIGNGTTILAENVPNIAQIQIIIRSGTNSNGLVFKPMVRLASVSDGTYAPYSNICPITGHTGANVSRTGKNLLVKPFVYFTEAPDTLDGCFLLKAGTYVLNVGSFTNATSWRFGVRLKDKNGNNLSDVSHKPMEWMSWNAPNNLWLGGSNTTGLESVFTMVEDCYVRFVFAVGDTSASTVANNVMLSLGSVSADYEPYQGNTYPITFPTPPGTVYGGTLTIHQDGSGELVVDHGIMDLGSINWNVSNGRFYTSAPSDFPDAIVNGHAGLCSTYQVFVGAYDTFITMDKVMQICNKSFSSSKFLMAIDSAYGGDKDAFKTGVSGQKLYYPLATTVTYQLTNQQVIETLKGVNNIWADTGKINAVDYPADTKLYIAKVIAELGS